MDMTPATLWWVLAGVAVAVELATGTFYLLMIAFGMAAGAIAAHLGLGVALQIVSAAIVGGGATALWHWRKTQDAPAAPAAQNRDVNLDVGERVHVSRWTVEHTTRVQYRGSQWEARLAPGAPAQSGEHLVSAVEGNWLVLTPAQPRH